MEHRVWFWVLGWMLTVLTVLGNGLLIYLIIARKRLHNTVNWFLFSLALADLCIGLTHFPTMAACNSPTHCNKCITTAFQWLFLNLSMTNLCALTVDRYVAIVSPFTYVVFKAKKRYLFLLLAAWVLPFVVHFTPFTWIYCTGKKEAVRNFLTAMLFIFKLPPFLLLFTTCSRTLYTVHKEKKHASFQLSQLEFNGFSPEDMATLRSQSQTRTFAKALGIIVAIFLICYAIDISRLICYTFHRIKYIPWVLVEIQDLLFVCNSASNPLVYAFLKRDIRHELKRSVKCLA